MTGAARDHAATVRARWLGAELRRLREAAGYGSQVEVASLVGMSLAKLSRLEGGKRRIKVEDAAALLALYRVTGPARENLLRLCREGAERGWWLRASAHEERVAVHTRFESWATAITEYQPLAIPVLLQTPEYLRATLESSGLAPSEVERGIRLGVARRGSLNRDFPPRYTALVGETALRCAAAAREVVADQFLHLTLMAHRPCVTLRVVPNSAAQAACGGAFALMDFAAAPALVALESATSFLYLEESHEVRTYRGLARSLLRHALSHDDSVRFVAELADGVDHVKTTPRASITTP
ncbi:Helix-turn-helix domain-containing protein [Streptoalloteichus tenebrarius]|uniref:Helix-turn-helix domain-containing protein n=1 Tax=Streptoalloteichus tenebrarius (strain ATCC 17920 / DSM 40477 / JCM 4838 / CBS 697.72 / NBRC 16177 / NCIMB 11028 / NRRL B-12390 / A12253. 1 / ISP 5477) TaxID=1933 RepID=A0ABT1HVM2_STRSD|nr:helix-turn-helix transcriptional regulator [Streptoalloteichus tenebrarius]MCP2259571.1 Helix-turn-helix domain-containing protein [Streptoalloteichus tenebrarius]BFF01022.1 helix-turn-helix transcriptional regulator [Streptoalloteichus tenebrarius]